MSDLPPAAPTAMDIRASTSSRDHTGRTIVVALDMSQRSRDTFAWTVSNMYRKDDKLLLVHVAAGAQVIASSLLGVSTPVYYIPEKEKHEAKKMLSNYATFCLVHDITHEAKLFEGDLEVVLREITAGVPNCVLVIGNHNKSATERVFLGSSSDLAVHAVPTPIIVVKQPHEVTMDRDTKRRIGICVDSSEHARAAFDWAVSELVGEGDTVFILHMSRAGRLEPNETKVDGVVSGDELIDVYSGLCESKHIDSHIVHSRTHKSISETMASLTDSLSLDCLVVGSRGRGAVKRTLFGSFSDGVVRACKCNVVVVK